MPHHDLLPSEPLVAHPLALLVVVGSVDVAPVRLRSWIRRVGDDVATGATELLLQHDRQGLPHDSAASATADSSAHTLPNASAHASAHASDHPAASHNSSDCSTRSPRPVRTS